MKFDITIFITMLESIKQLLLEANDLVVNHKYKEALYKINSIRQYELDSVLLEQVNALENTLVNELSKYKQED